MSTKNDSTRNSELLEGRNRRMVTVWIISIATFKLFVVDISLFLLRKTLGINPTDLKIFIGTDTLLVGVILRIMVKYYFPDRHKTEKTKLDG